LPDISNIEYYNKNADAFFNETVNADMSLWQKKFISYLPPKGRILDAGCGSGRDSKAFMNAGFSVVAFDASEKMCEMATEYIGQPVLQMSFEDIAFEDEFDGIWACASLLHVPNYELPEVLDKLRKSLKKGGHLYASFKYGEGMMEKGERSFSNFNEKTVTSMMEEAGFIVCECNVSSDIRPGREDEKWVNVITVSLD